LTLSLSGHVALVTGGSRGIGAAIAVALAEAGADIALNYRERSDAAESVARSVRATGRNARVIAADVSDSRSVARMVEDVRSSLGPVDILVNNAGIGMKRSPSELTEEEWDATIAVNLKGAFLSSEACRRAASDASSTSPRVPRVAPAASACITTPRRPGSRG
jgi:3-oxoacyl-[acyl-carrier protein] reductase